MDTTARRRRIHRQVEDSLTSKMYIHDVSLYKDPPMLEISLSEFEELAVDRLKLLRIIEEASLKGPKVYSDEWRALIKEDLLKENLRKYVRLLGASCGQTEADIQARRADHISHYILRLAYCRSEELRRWFVNRELEWFRLKFVSKIPQMVQKFLSLNDFSYNPITVEEREILLPHLLAATSNMSDVMVSTTEFYKVPFKEVLSLVKNRRIYLAAGFAYIPMSDLVVCIQSKFRAQLNKSLNIYNQKLPKLDDERLDNMLGNLHHAHTGNSHNYEGGSKEAIDPEQLDDLSKKHYPLCMRTTHEVLRRDHHLKHQSRLQYGLFIKGIGVLYEKAVEFWRKEFTHKMDSSKFDKSYLYNINHTYGKVGAKIDYSPFSCIKIILSNVAAGECNGCPFKQWDIAVLRNKLHEHKVSHEGETEILELAKGNHYQIACTKYFQYTHGGKAPVQTINHPNQYFEESRNLEKGKTDNLFEREFYNEDCNSTGSSCLSPISSNREEEWPLEEKCKEIAEAKGNPSIPEYGGLNKNNAIRHAPKKPYPLSEERCPQLVAKRNARERRRVHTVNDAFVRLRHALPYEHARGKRISKVKTLRRAIEYIQCLTKILQDYMNFNYDFLENIYEETDRNVAESDFKVYQKWRN